MIETHAHIFLPQFTDDLAEVIDRAQRSGIDKILMPNIDVSTISEMIKVEKQFPEICKSMIGLHPCSVKADYKNELDEIHRVISDHSFVAIGEIGTDLYWDKTFWEQQKDAFLVQLEWAITYQLPTVIHCRESIDETIELIKRKPVRENAGVFHCFTGTVKQANQIIEHGYKIGIGGVATFKNGGITPVIEQIDLENVVLETDSPYLAPTPFRGKRNEPSYLKMIGQKIAEIKNISLEEVILKTDATAKELFNL